MKRDIITSVIAVIVFTLLLGIVYPLFITGVGQVAFPGNANGQQIHVNGRLIGSKIIGQSFAAPVIGKNGKPEEKEEELVTQKPTRATSRAGRRRPKAAPTTRRRAPSPTAARTASRPRKPTKKTSRNTWH